MTNTAIKEEELIEKEHNLGEKQVPVSSTEIRVNSEGSFRTVSNHKRNNNTCNVIRHMNEDMNNYKRVNRFASWHNVLDDESRLLPNDYEVVCNLESERK